MAGYYNFSMSNNAVAAYDSGEKPISKWTKLEILEAIEMAVEENKVSIDFDLLKKVSAKILKDEFLYKSSWHHTAKFYNRTDFYSVDEEKITELTNDKIMTLIEKSKQKKEEVKKEIPVIEKWEIEYLVWGGTRKHPKATVERDIAEIKGNWAFLQNGSKKATTANGFRFIKKID